LIRTLVKRVEIGQDNNSVRHSNCY
jgi:hypothetical protein